MKKTMFILVLFILNIGLSGCGSETPSQSSFKDDFTIGTIVEDNSQFLIPGTRELSGHEYGATERPFTQKQEEIAL